MNNLEELLRSDLHRATELIDTEPEVAGALVAGRHARRSMLTRRTIGGTAASLVVLLLAWVGLGPRVIPGLPEPAQTVSATPAPTESEAVTLDLTEGFATNGVQAPYTRLEVTVTRARGGYDVMFVAIGRDGTPTASTGHVEDGRILIHEYRRMTVGLVADRVLWRESVYRKMSGGVVSQDVPARDQPVTVMVDVAEKAGGSIRGVLWAGLDGTVRNDHGSEVPCAKVGVSTGVGLVCVDEGLGTLLYRAPENRGFMNDRLSSEDRIVRIESWDSGDGGERTATAVGLLPMGASDPAVSLSRAGVEWSSAKLSGSGQVVFVAVGKPSKGDRRPLVTEVSYTDADGKLVRDRHPSAP